ncbi:MAG: asparagine synthase (glutamine-hydrolyzing) [Opitutus sp.]|nr:asparagine synthase (glutamine-hydrolyzing) [Opitutus sp.]
MCGIAGIVDARAAPVSREEAVRRMVARQSHRGPDDSGMISADEATLGMCRLAIFDPVHGRQPMATPDGRFHLVFNGAIYNFSELRGELEAKGRSFRTRCDTEVLLAAHAEWGEGCLARLRGMFAFAVWDRRERTLFAARDPFGIKPLYYTRPRGEAFVFASELNVLLASGAPAREIDPVAVGDYLAWFAVPAPRTLYRGIANLPPGHCLRVHADGRCAVWPWWRLPRARVEPATRSYEEFVGELRERLKDTIRAHRLADVPVGAFLSGGLDSTSIVGLMAQTGAARLKTFSLVFEETEYSERESARLAAQALGTEHHETVLTGGRVAADLPRLLRQFDQPTGDGLNTYYAAQAAREGGVKVVLSGLGGDELFGGYDSFADVPRLARWLPWWRQLPGAMRQPLVGLLRTRGAWARKFADFLAYGRDVQEICSLRRRVLAETSRLELLAPEARRLAARLGPYHPRLDDFAFELTGADPAQSVSAWEMRTYMADVLLRDSDVFSMAHSLELRVPFVDRVLVEWWWNQPQAHRFDPSRPKGALADAVAGVVPEPIRRRAKQGFALPFPRWMKSELRPFLAEAFSPASLAACPWLDAGNVQRDWLRFTSGADTRSWSRIWTIAILIAFANRPRD